MRSRPWTFRPWREEDLEVAERLKPADVAEIHAASGMEPVQAVAISVNASDWCESIEVAGKVEAVWGLSGVGEGLGVPWMLSTRVLVADKRQLVEQGRRIIADCLGRHPRLMQWVDLRNRESRNWLRRLGFKETQLAATYGVAGIPFVCMEAWRD